MTAVLHCAPDDRARSQRHTPPRETLSAPEPMRRGLHPQVLLLAIIAGAVAVIGLWWQDTPSIHGLGDWITNAGRVLGLLAGYAVVVLLGLMARVPAVERGVGADRLARWHAMGGRYTVSLVVAHALLIIWGYAITVHRNVFSETATLLTTYADVLMATVALGLFVGVGISSARAARRRLRYETWHFLHFYTYLATALAFSHQFSTGADFVDNQLARVAWAALYIFVGTALLWHRFLTPVRQAFRHQLRVHHVVIEGPDVVSVWISGRHVDELAAQPGQFFRWRFINRASWWAANPYSLSAPPHSGLLRITVKEFGDHSRALRDLRPGTRVITEGPYGAMTAARRTRRDVLLIAGGVGITPLRALFESLPGQSRSGQSGRPGAGGPGDIALLYRASKPEEVLFRDELDAIAARTGARVGYFIGPRRSKADIFMPGALQHILPDIAQRDVYLCGPSGLTTAARRALRQAKVPRRRIHTEDFEF